MKFYDADFMLQVILQMKEQLQIRWCIRIIFFFFLHENICCGYSLEAHTSFSWKNKKKYQQLFVEKKKQQKKTSYPELW